MQKLVVGVIGVRILLLNLLLIKEMFDGIIVQKIQAFGEYFSFLVLLTGFQKIVNGDEELFMLFIYHFVPCCQTVIPLILKHIFLLCLEPDYTGQAKLAFSTIGLFRSFNF
jgi:hypothetical protein